KKTEELSEKSKALKQSLYEYQTKIDIWSRQIGITSSSFTKVIFQSLNAHSNMLSQLINYRNMIQEGEFREAVKETKGLDSESFSYAVKKFSADYDMIKNTMQISRKDKKIASQSFYYDLRKIRRNTQDLYNMLVLN
ncbi:MAG: hypothetical protein ACRCXZ_05095, partial [Patescibacteria group bacterium]